MHIPTLQPHVSQVGIAAICVTRSELLARSGGGAINAATVRVTPFDPFSISVGEHELQVTLVDTPGYGEFVNTEASFEVIGRYVEVQLTPAHRGPWP